MTWKQPPPVDIGAVQLRYLIVSGCAVLYLLATCGEKLLWAVLVYVAMATRFLIIMFEQGILVSLVDLVGLAAGAFVERVCAFGDVMLG